MAAVTAILWLRCIILLRLTESFGPLITMIVRMTFVVLEFLLIYGIGIVVLAAIASLTLHENENFENLF